MERFSDSAAREIGGQGCDPYNRPAPRQPDAIDWQNPPVIRVDGLVAYELLLPGEAT